MSILIFLISFNFFNFEDDPTGFTQALNARRAQYNLPPVAYNPAAVSHANYNNYQQSIYGLGHHWTGGFGQCAGYCNDMISALAAWEGSPAHAALIFSPSLVSVGYASNGYWHTVSTLQNVTYYQYYQYPIYQYQYQYPIYFRR